MLGSDLKKYLFAIFIPALVLTLAGLYFLYRQDAYNARRLAEARFARIENLAAEFQDALRDTAPQARFTMLSSVMGDELFAGASGAYRWRPQGAEARVLGPKGWVLERIASYTRWNEWTSEGKKSARRGMLRLDRDGGEGAYLLWCRLDDDIYALSYSDPPLALPGDSALWPVGLGGALLAAAILCSGGLLLWRAAEKARGADTMKTTFVSNVSHELKTPLTAIQLWTGLLESGTLKSDEQRLKAYSILSSETERLLRLVENLLDCTRLEQGRKRYRIAPVDLGALAREEAQLSMLSVAQFQVAVVLEEREVQAQADSDAVRQIVKNLLENARKYAASGGGAELTVRLTGAGAELAVADRGPGMGAEERKHVFERFYRGEAVAFSGIGGQGLGLAISRALALDMGGELTVEERKGGGCVFKLLLPGVTKAKGSGV